MTVSFIPDTFMVTQSKHFCIGRATNQRGSFQERSSTNTGISNISNEHNYRHISIRERKGGGIFQMGAGKPEIRSADCGSSAFVLVNRAVVPMEVGTSLAVPRQDVDSRRLQAGNETPDSDFPCYYRSSGRSDVVLSLEIEIRNGRRRHISSISGTTFGGRENNGKGQDL